MCDNPVNASYLCALIITQLKRADNSINCDNSINFDGEREVVKIFLKEFKTKLSRFRIYNIGFYFQKFILFKTFMLKI